MEKLGHCLTQLVLPVLEDDGCELVALECKGRPGSINVKVFIEAAGGVTLKQCESVSRRLSDILDAEDVIPGKYRLEVSSPGVDRPLTGFKDFRRNLNKNIDLDYEDADGKQRFHGEIVDVSEERIVLKGKKETREIPLSRINRGVISLPW